MNKAARILLIVIVLSLSACAAKSPEPSATPSPPTAQPTAPAKTGTLRIDTPSLGTNDIPVWIALDTLRQQGYVVETTAYARWDLVTAGLASGEVDIASSGHQAAWAAIAKGAPIRAIVGRYGLMYVLSAKSEIKTCADLQGKSLALATTTGVIGALIDGYFERSCPGTQPQTIVIPSPSNRLPALLSGAVDAAQLDEDEAAQVEFQAPGKFHVLCHFAEEFPLVDLNAFYAHNDFAAEHPDIVKDFVMALVEANRRVQDPQILREAIEHYIPGDASALAAADACLAHKAWDVNGGLTAERLQYTLNFLTEADVVPSGLQVEKLVDLSYLNAVLDEIGRE